MHFIIRLFPEIIVKSAGVRKLWSKQLANNIRVMTRRIHEKASVRLDWDRILVRIPGENSDTEARVVALLARTPGIANISKVTNHDYQSFDDILEGVMATWHDKLQGLSFCVRVKRSGNHTFSSTDLERFIGAGLLAGTDNKGVQLKKPDVTVHIEVKDNKYHLVEHKIPGLGGFPIGTQGAVLSLISGGYDSTVASYMLMRRGVKTHFCFFNLGGREHEVAVKELAFYLWHHYASSHRVRFVTVPFEDVVGEIMRTISPSETGVVLKRMMLRAATRIADDGGLNALVTGEAISQVSSQTLDNLRLIDAVSDRPILRPLVASDKTDIIALSRQIGAETFCAAIPEYCGAISVKPSAKVDRSKLEAQEDRFNFDVLERSVALSIVEKIDDVIVSSSGENPTIDEVAVPEKDDIIVDIRHPNDVELKPLIQNNCLALAIPFYTFNSQLEHLDRSRRHLLYCDKGVMSRLHAAHLLDSSDLNIAVYRPDLKP